MIQQSLGYYLENQKKELPKHFEIGLKSNSMWSTSFRIEFVHTFEGKKRIESETAMYDEEKGAWVFYLYQFHFTDILQELFQEGTS